jgi:serine/threonine-protein kinase HipA
MVGDTPVLLTRRFDRAGAARIPFLSAMSLLDARDGETRSYVEIADAVRRIASRASKEGPQLWRRLAFNILASNFDDHLRNHAVIYDGAGWGMSPAYDLNPVPRTEKDRVLSTAINIDDDTTASIELAIEAAKEFLLSRDEARTIAGHVARKIASWRVDAAHMGVTFGEIERMESAFEHSDASLARQMK